MTVLSDAAAIDDQRLAEGIALANIPTLLVVLVQLTGDLRWLEEPYRPVRARGFGENDGGGLAPEVQSEIRDAAIEAIAAWRRDGEVALPSPDTELLVRMLSWAMDEPVPAEYGAMIADQLGTEPGERRGLQVPEGFHVLVIGAGVAGICAAYHLQQAGIPYAVVEKDGSVGGTWRDNHYPGAGVDVPNHLYAYSFAPHDWSMYFALRDEIRDYLESVVDRFGLRSSIELDTAVEGLDYDPDEQRWAVRLRGADGSIETVRPNVVVSAVGIFNPPKVPAIPGLQSFAGDVVHTASWDDDVALDGRRVAMIGSGASAMQVGPEIQHRVEHLEVFQRSPSWAAPFEQFRREMPDAVRDLMQAVPLYRGWYRVRLGWMFNDRMYASLRKDPSWKHPDRSLNAHNDAQRRIFTDYIESELGDRADLLPSVVPTYPPFGKRMLLDNGWYRMLRNPKVSLVTTPIEEIDATGIVTADGVHHDVDVIVLATGFDVQRYLSGFEVHGRGGQSLREAWNDTDPRAFMAGLTVPGFPNLFILYGPNSQPGHGGSVVGIMEMLMRYVTDAIECMVDQGIGELECRQDACDEYVAAIDAEHEELVWTHEGMSTYYRNEAGRVVVIYPFRNVDLFHATKTFTLDPYHATPHGQPGTQDEN